MTPITVKSEPDPDLHDFPHLPRVPLTPTMRMLVDLVAHARYETNQRQGHEHQDFTGWQGKDFARSPDYLGAVGELVALVWLGGLPANHWNAILPWPDPGVDLITEGGATIDVKYASQPLGPYRVNKVDAGSFSADYGVIVYPDTVGGLVQDPPVYVIGGAISREKFRKLAVTDDFHGQRHLKVEHHRLGDPALLLAKLVMTQTTRPPEKGLGGWANVPIGDR